MNTNFPLPRITGSDAPRVTSEVLSDMRVRGSGEVVRGRLIRCRMGGNENPHSPPAFTLVELLVVVAIILVLMALLAPAFNALKGAGTLGKSAYDIVGILENARAYAMANRTYVYVGFQEVDASNAESANPQTPATSAVGGRVAVATVTTRDGTRGYSLSSNLPDPAWANYNNGANLVALGPLKRLDNLHLAASLGAPPSNGGMVRPSVLSTYRLGHEDCESVTPFTWPLGSALEPGSAQYYFAKVIQFDPQGTARIQYASNRDNIVRYMEIGLQQTNGNAVPPPPADPGTGPQAAIQIDGMTGAVRLYRP
jgi:prepilin-type N-terminal cleavage/methylation domain-containing protein